MAWNKSIPRTVGIGIQDFTKVVTNQCFYVDKADFIREWRENMDDVTLITRPRRFGNTLTMSMVELEPKRAEDPAFVIEFKVVYVKRGETLEDGVRSALEQIEEKQYEMVLRSKGIASERIRKYGFAFEGAGC